VSTIVLVSCDRGIRKKFTERKNFEFSTVIACSERAGLPTRRVPLLYALVSGLDTYLVPIHKQTHRKDAKSAKSLCDVITEPDYP